MVQGVLSLLGCRSYLGWGETEEGRTVNTCMLPERLWRGWRTGVLLAIMAGFSPAVMAAADCYDQNPYPAALRIEPLGDDGFRIYLPSRDYSFETFAEARRKGGKPPAYTHPVIAYRPGKGFFLEKPLSCLAEWNCAATPLNEKTCPTDMPPQKVLIENAKRADPTLVKSLGSIPDVLADQDVVDQNYSACVAQGSSVWFGIGFYDGDGPPGIGGLGRYDVKTKRMELRRPRFLHDSSILHIHHDGERLWLATAGHYECMGTPPTLGLVGYDWKTRRVRTFLGGDDGPCGLLVNGFLQRGDDMWVATDLGLSRWNRKSSRWTNYLPMPSATPPLRETSCPDLYRHLTETLPHSGWSDVQPAASPYHQLMENLAKLRPRAVDAATLV